MTIDNGGVDKLVRGATPAAQSGPEHVEVPVAYDAILLASFGGPEGQDDVIPFLRNVTRGRGIPEERLEEVAHHYRAFGGVSPINDQNRELKAALEAPELVDLVDLMRHLRQTEARRHVREEVPFYTGRRIQISEIAEVVA